MTTFHRMEKFSRRTADMIMLKHGEELVLPFPMSSIMDYKDLLIKQEENKITIGYLSDDEWHGGDYWEEMNEGEFIDLKDIDLDAYLPEDEEDTRSGLEVYLAELEAKNPGRVFRVSKYEHSLVRYYVGTGSICPWDTTVGRYVYIAPEDATDPAKYAESVMEEYTNWCNGNIYGKIIASYVKKLVGPFDEEVWEQEGSEDACWGYIGDDHAYEALKHEFPE